MPDLLTRLKETTSYIQSVYPARPAVGIILGSGLGNLVSQMEVEKEIAYDAIPHFPVSTVEGHHGKLIFGTLKGKRVVAMSGRFHYYEGYAAKAPQPVH